MDFYIEIEACLSKGDVCSFRHDPEIEQSAEAHVEWSATFTFRVP
jgi:hypothetical protein